MERQSTAKSIEMLDKSRGGLLRYLLGYSLSVEEAEDIIHDTFERMLKLINNGIQLHSEAILFKTAKNLMLNKFRRNQLEKRAEESLLLTAETSGIGVTGDRHLEDQQSLQRVLDIVNELPAKCREVYYLRHVEGMTYASIAEKMEISISAVEKHIAKGLLYTHKRFKEENIAALLPFKTRRVV